MEHNLADITGVEKQVITDCKALLAAKTKEIATNTAFLSSRGSQ